MNPNIISLLNEINDLNFNYETTETIINSDFRIAISSEVDKKSIIETIKSNYDHMQLSYLQNCYLSCNYIKPKDIIQKNKLYIQTSWGLNKSLIELRDKEYFTIGGVYSEQSKDLKIKQSLIVNEIQIAEDLIANMHLLVDYSLILAHNQLDQYYDDLEHVMKSVDYCKSKISPRSINLIKKKINPPRCVRVQDISCKRGCQTIIEIKKNSMNNQLTYQSKFMIGNSVNIFVKQCYSNLQQFLEKYQKKEDSFEEFFFGAITSIRSKVRYVGIDIGLQTIINEIQNKNMTLEKFKDYYMQHDNDYLIQKCLKCPSVLIQVLKDPSPIEYYLLIAEQKTVFLIGRADGSDIQLQSLQVSRYHGQIDYKGNNVWTIMDGQSLYDSNQRSSLGTWRIMNQGEKYLLGLDQVVKIGNTNIQFELIENSDQEMQKQEQLFIQSPWQQIKKII